VVAPVRYTSLIWATLLGFMVWGELPDAWVVLGAVVIVASGVYMLRVETRTRVEGLP
jgi:drug/metabolite transporter (DMT)-like permease